jgi:hypothetical protein
MPILLNVLIGVPQMLSNIQMILICVGVSSETLARKFTFARKELTMVSSLCRRTFFPH